MTGASPDLSRDLDDIIQAVLTRLIGWRDSSQDSLLFSVDLADATDEQIALNINIMKLLSFSLDCGGANKFDSHHWDFILCSLASWIQVSFYRFCPPEETVWSNENTYIGSISRGLHCAAVKNYLNKVV